MITAITLLVLSVVLSEAVNIRNANLLPKADTLPKVPDVENLRYIYILVREGHVVPELDPLTTDQQYKEPWRDLRGHTVLYGDRLMKFLGRSLKTRYEDFLLELYRSSDAVFSYTDPLEAVRGSCDRLRQAALLVQGEMLGHHTVSDLATSLTHRRCYGHLNQCPEYQRMKELVIDTDKKLSSVAPFTPFSTLKENYRLFTIENFERAMETSAAAPQYLNEMAAKYANRITRGFSNIDAFTLGRLFHDMYLDYSQGVKLRVHVADDLLASAFLSDLARDYRFAQFGDAVILEVRKLGVDQHFIQAYHYSPLQEEGSRLREVAAGPSTLCSRYLRLNPVFRQCPLGHFMCDHEPSSLKSVRRLCSSRDYVGLMKTAYRRTCADLASKLAKVEIEL